MSEEVNPSPVNYGSHLDPVAQSRGYFGGGQFPAGPSGPAVIPEGGWKVGSNSFAKAGVVSGVLGIVSGWIQIVGLLFALGFAGLAIGLGAAGVVRSTRHSSAPGRYIALLAIALGIGVVVWKIVEGVGPGLIGGNGSYLYTG
jgi:hypothetical protein